jgi:hypothetical protein
MTDLFVSGKPRCETLDLQGPPLTGAQLAAIFKSLEVGLCVLSVFCVFARALTIPRSAIWQTNAFVQRLMIENCNFDDGAIDALVAMIKVLLSVLALMSLPVFEGFRVLVCLFFCGDGTATCRG